MNTRRTFNNLYLTRNLARVRDLMRSHQLPPGITRYLLRIASTTGNNLQVVVN